MGVIASLDESEIFVEPGGTAVCAVRLYNTGQVVDTFTLDVLGDATEWISVEPASVNVFPGEDAVAQVVFRPPRSATVPGGTKTYAVRVMAQEDTEGSTVQEGSVEVGTYSEVTAELVPRTVRGARSARSRLAIDNVGNGPVSVQLMGGDESGEITFGFTPARLTVEGGTTRLVPVRMRMRRRFLTGAAKSHPVEITVLTDDGTRTQTQGVLVQPPLLPRWLPKVLTLLTAAVVLVLVIGPTILNAAPESNATSKEESVEGQDGSTGNPVDGKTPNEGDQPDGGDKNAGDGSTIGGDKGAEGATSSGGGNGTTGDKDKDKDKDTGTGIGGGTGVGAAGLVDIETVSVRLGDNKIKESATPRYTVTSYTVGKDQTLSVSDIILQVPDGETGQVEIRRNDAMFLTFPLSKGSQQVHYINPMEFQAGERIVFAVDCRSSDSGSCKPGVQLSARKITRAGS
ncbi:COG1470 family protein [Streptomyces vinaceus]|uniref:COG1470 family protein n=1 Tax=Streptomyces vinaceus TaxID=1960 RepID=UPI0037F83B9B